MAAPGVILVSDQVKSRLPTDIEIVESAHPAASEVVGYRAAKEVSS